MGWGETKGREAVSPVELVRGGDTELKPRMS